MSNIAMQSNAITKSRRSFTAIEKNIIYMLLGSLVEKKRFYYLSVKEMMQKTKVKNAYSDYKEACDSLVGKVIKMKPEDTINGNALTVSICSSAEYMEGQGLIELEISDKLSPYLFDLKNNFTAFQIDMGLSMKSYYAKELYEMLSQYKTTSFFTITVEELKHRLSIESKYSRFVDFERRVIAPAVNEINKYSDIKTKCIPRKRGRSVYSLDFTIKYEARQTSISFKDDNQVLFDRLVNKFLLSKAQAKKVIKDNDPKYINKVLYELQTANIKTSIGGYTAVKFGVKFIKK